MSRAAITGRVHSFQSLGTLDGPGVRFVVFLQGCHLRCGCCHNPDTWTMTEGSVYTPQEIVRRALRYREYFAREVFHFCHKEGLHTCLDTSGSLWNDSVEALLAETDRVLLDVKYTDAAMYPKHVGCEMSTPLAFLAYLNEQKIPTTLRQVIIPTLNDSNTNMLALKRLIEQNSCIDKTELLPFKKLCQSKYDQMGIPFPFGHLPEPTKDEMAALESILHT